MASPLQDAVAMLRNGLSREALQRLTKITEAQPGNAEAQNWLAVAHAKLRQFDLAAAASQKAIALAPGNAAYYLTAANIRQDQGDLAAAAVLLQDAVRVSPAFAEAQNNLGIVLTDLGRFDEAMAAFEGAITARPDYPRAWANLAAARLRLMKPDEALAAARRSLELKADNAHAHLVCGNALVMLGDSAAAEPCLREALRLQPDFAEAALLLAKTLVKLKRRDEAEALVRAALQRSPARKELWTLLGELAGEVDNLAEAAAAFQRALQLKPDDLANSIRLALLLPSIYASEAHLQSCRRQVTAGIAALQANAAALAASTPRERLAEAVTNSFLLAYQGQDDRALQRGFADFIHAVAERNMPELLAPRPAAPAAGRRIRIGFCSRFFYRSTAGNYFASWITDLDPARFEIFVYHTHVANDELTARIKQAAGHFVQAEENFTRFASRIPADRLDILVYPEIGMDRVTYLLAALRLAPVQVAGWGHPVTPGHRNIDCFVTCEAMEPPGAAAHYNEPLVMLPGIGTRYDTPAISAAVAGKGRADYQLPEKAHLYLFPQSLFKVHPANDALLAAALAADPEGVLVLFAGQNPAITQRFVARLSAAFSTQGVAAAGRVRILPGVGHDDYKRINQLSDLMLDSLHWSGGNTSLDALAMGLPIVTLPGEFMRGRQTMAMLRLIGVDELIAASPAEYLATARRLATEPGYRDNVSARILQNRHRLFDDPAPPRQLAAIFERMVLQAERPHA